MYNLRCILQIIKGVFMVKDYGLDKKFCQNIKYFNRIKKTGFNTL